MTETLLEAVYDFIEEYTKIDEDKIYRGWQNRMALPTTNEYIVYYVRDTTRVGTNVRYWEYTTEKTTNNVLREYDVSIDVYDIDHDQALERINALEIMARSYEGVKFMKELGFNLEYAEDFRLIPYTESNNQYIYRYNMELKLSAWESYETFQDYAEEVKITKFADVEDPVTHEIVHKRVITDVPDEIPFE